MRVIAQLWLCGLVYAASLLDLGCVAAAAGGVALEDCAADRGRLHGILLGAMLFAIPVATAAHSAHTVASYAKVTARLGPARTERLAFMNWDEAAAMLCDEVLEDGWRPCHVRRIVARFDDYIQCLSLEHPELMPPAIPLLWSSPGLPVALHSECVDFILVELVFPLLLNRRFRHMIGDRHMAWALRMLGAVYVAAIPALVIHRAATACGRFCARRGAALAAPRWSVTRGASRAMRRFGELPHERWARDREFAEAYTELLAHAPYLGWQELGLRLVAALSAGAAGVLFVLAFLVNDETTLATLGGMRLYWWASLVGLAMAATAREERRHPADKATAAAVERITNTTTVTTAARDAASRRVQSATFGGMFEEIGGLVVIIPWLLMCHLPRHHDRLFLAVVGCTTDEEKVGNVAILKEKAIDLSTNHAEAQT